MLVSQYILDNVDNNMFPIFYLVDLTEVLRKVSEFVTKMLIFLKKNIVNMKSTA